MSKSSYDNISRPVRKRSAVTGHLVGVRLQADQLKAIDAWAAKQEPAVTRPEAIRSMIDAMLNIFAKDPGENRVSKPGRASRAAELAGKVINKIGDPAASTEERDE